MTCASCGDTVGPFVRTDGRVVCEDCHEDGAQ